MVRFTLILLGFVLSFNVHAQLKYSQLNLLGGTIEIKHEVEGALLEKISSHSPFYGVALSQSFFDANQREELLQRGIAIGDYVGNQCYYIYIHEEVTKAELTTFGVLGLQKLPASVKLDPTLNSGFSFPEHVLVDGLLKLNVIVSEYAHQANVHSEFAKLEVQVVKVSALASTFRVQVPMYNLSKVAALDFVQFIEPIDQKGEPENYKARNSHRVGSLTKNFTGLSKELDGSGISVMLQDDGVIGPHLDYAGRIGAQYIATNNGDHGDHCGGTIMAAGNLDPLGKGMAPAATIYVYGAAGEGYPGFDSIASHYSKHDIKITSTSYSNGQNAGYTSFARELDIQTEQMPSLLHVFSAGNAGRNNGGWYNITGGHKVAKNVLAVANLTYLDEVNASSSRGPAQDGRIKPEISAVGTQVWSTSDVNDYVFKTGTSMSCPGVSGTMALLYQAYKEKHNNMYPEAVFMKAVACNTADDVGNAGPDFKYGFGRINARKAFKVIDGATHFSGTVANGGSNSHQITIPANKKLAKIMLAWNDPRGAANASVPLVNNLDLELVDPNNKTYLPFVLDISSVDSLDNPAKNGVDNINNMEQIAITNMPTGSYTINVKGTALAQGPQKYHVIYYLEDEGIELEYPTGGESFVPGENEVIRWSAPVKVGTFTLEYSLDSGNTWNTISTIVPARDRFYEWRVVNGFTGKAMINISANGISDKSNTFTISPQPSGINITKICPDSMELSWANMNGAANFNIYTMGQKYMEVIATQMQSPYVYKGANYNPFQEMHFALDAVNADGTKSRRTKSIIKVPRLLNCPLSSDLEVTTIAQGGGSIVDCGTVNNQKTVKVEIENKENSTFNNLDVYMQVNGGAVVKESYVGLIGIGQTIYYTFTQKATYNLGSNTLKVWMDDPADQNRFNDTLVSNVEIYESDVVQPSCYTYDFESVDLCGVENDCGITTCSLTEGWINAINGFEDDIDWRVDRAGTNTRTTGPTVDNTTGNGSGKYVYLESSGDCANQEASLISPCIDLTGGRNPKLNYWYHMYGVDMGELHVDLYKNGVWTNDITTIVSGDVGNRWTNNEIDLSTHIGSVIRIRFRGITGNGIRSDIALDDIKFTDVPKANFTYTKLPNGKYEFNVTTPGAISYYWEFSNVDTSTASSPTYEFYSGEEHVVFLKVETQCGVDSVKMEVLTDIAELKSLGSVSIYPNPAEDFVTLNWNKSNLSEVQVSLQDINGKVVLVPNLETSTTELELDVSQLERGVYLIEIQHSKGTQTQKLIIQ